MDLDRGEIRPKGIKLVGGGVVDSANYPNPRFGARKEETFA